VTSLDDLARAANSIPPPDFAALFPAVAGNQDAIAGQVLFRAAAELAHVVAIVSHRLFPKEDGATIPVAMTGGVFRHSQPVREAFYHELRNLEPRAEIVPQVVDPVEGALRMARRGLTVTG
jgi:N-acetylglucosamine kinase-like BadF-type ATPase